jgi:uncharacterized membrane protein YgcG
MAEERDLPVGEPTFRPLVSRPVMGAIIINSREAPMAPKAAALVVGVLLVLAGAAAQAEVWRCHTPTGDVWTDDRSGYGDCEQFEGRFERKRTLAPSENPAQPQTPPPVAQSPAAPPPPPAVQAPAIAPPVYYPTPSYADSVPYPVPYPVPYAVPSPSYPYYPGSFYFGSPGLYLGVPGIVFDFRFGGGHFRHFGGRHFGGGHIGKFGSGHIGRFGGGHIGRFGGGHSGGGFRGGGRGHR